MVRANRFVRIARATKFPSVSPRKKTPQKIQQKLSRIIHPAICSDNFPSDSCRSLFSATKMTGRPGHWSERGEYNILFLGSILDISSQDSSALGYREFTQEGPMTISPYAAREGTSTPQWPNVKKCCRHLVPSSDFFVQSYAVPIFLRISAFRRAA